MTIAVGSAIPRSLPTVARTIVRIVASSQIGRIGQCQSKRTAKREKTNNKRLIIWLQAAWSHGSARDWARPTRK
jgi:hypothetical protein